MRCALEGVQRRSKVRVCPPGIDVERFAGPPHPEISDHLIVSPGRLVWEKGHHDVLRALAALHRGLVTGAGRRHAASPPGDRRHGPGRGTAARARRASSGSPSFVEITSVPYEQMPGVFARASAMVLASQASASAAYHLFDMPSAFWEEQFGLVLAEAMAAELAIVTTTSGAIPEVLSGTPATLVAPGDWMGIARALASGPLARPPAARVAYSPEVVSRYSTEAAAAGWRTPTTSCSRGGPAEVRGPARRPEPDLPCPRRDRRHGDRRAAS